MQDYPYQLLARWIRNDPEAWIALGNFETMCLRGKLKKIVSPIYVSGMARAGTTILTEALALHPSVATHCYRDFPCLFTPFLWNKLLATFDWVPFKKKPQERAHKDGIMVTSQSAESMEEMLWMAFFKRLHEDTHSVVLSERTGNVERDQRFSAFYKNHIQKLLLAKKKERYVSKANYNITRIPYILNMMNDARFVIVVRHPYHHVMSSYQKDSLFCHEQEKSQSALTHMDQIGHFEFGQHRTFIHTGDDLTMATIRTAFLSGEKVRGWALYWSMLHKFIAEISKKYPEVLVVRHEDLSSHPQATIKQILEHGSLNSHDDIVDKMAATYRIEPRQVLSDAMRSIIREETKDVAALWGYNFDI